MYNFDIIFFEVVSSGVNFIFPGNFAAQKRHRRVLSTGIAQRIVCFFADNSTKTVNLYGTHAAFLLKNA